MWPQAPTTRRHHEETNTLTPPQDGETSRGKCHRTNAQRRPGRPVTIHSQALLCVLRFPGSGRDGDRPDPRPCRPQSGSRRRRQPELAGADAVDRRHDLRAAAADAGAAADLHGHRRLDQQSAAAVECRGAGLADAAVVCHHRADRRADRHRARTDHSARHQHRRSRRRRQGTLDAGQLARLPERSRARQRLRPAGIDQDHRRRSNHLARLQRAADPGDLDRRRRCGAEGRRARQHLPRLQRVAAGGRAQDPVVGDPAHAHRHDRPARQRRRAIWLDDAGAALLVCAGRLYRPRDRACWSSTRPC